MTENTKPETVLHNSVGFDDISDSELLDIDLDLCTASLTRSDSHVTCCSTALSEDSKVSEMEGDSEDKFRKKRKQDKQSPLKRFNLRYLCVTDLCSQSWCEQQMVYGLEMPYLQQLEKAPEVELGASIHLAKELEVHDIVSVSVKTREDAWAVKLLNLLSMITVLQQGGRVRELPVFGVIEGIFLVGVIDELHYSPKGELELCELKTRSQPSVPGVAQKRSHHLQVSVYKLLFDSMVKGQLKQGSLPQYLCLKTETALGSQVLEHARKLGLNVSSFGDLLELAFLNLRFSDIPAIDSLKIEYCYQANNSPLGEDIVHFDEQQVTRELHFYSMYWIGEREAQGVDIEDAWKCRYCDFADVCEWRMRRAGNTIWKQRTKRAK